MSEQELLQAAVSAFKTNDKARAVSILAGLVQQYPRSERGWYLLGMCMDSADKRTYCFQRVLDINPNNADAKKALAPLSPPKPALPTQAPHTPIASPLGTSTTPRQAPLVAEKQFVEESRKEQSPSQARTQPLPVKPPTQTRKKKRNNAAVFLAIVGGLCILALAAGADFMIISGGLANPAALPPAPVATSTMPALIGETPGATGESIALTSLPTALPTIAYTPTYEESICPFTVPGGVNVTCGYVTVPENRAKNNGRTLRLLVAVFHSKSQSPRPDPVVFLQGGPGIEAIQVSVDLYDMLVDPFLDERDYIVFDQRGTGFSQPPMPCDELDRVYQQDIYGNLASESKELVYQNAFLSCSGLLQANGIDLDGYSTVESAADLRDIVKLLSYEQVNLFGVSYGTRLALVTMRAHPEIVRASILDSVVPVETNLVIEYSKTVESSLTHLFNSCAADLNCSSVYPDLKEVFWSLIHDLDASPVTLTTSAYPIGTVTETVDGSYLLSTTLGLLRSPLFIHTVPQTIYRVRNGDYSTLIAAQYSLPYAFTSASPGLYVTIMCREHVLASSPEKLANASLQVGVQEHVLRPFYLSFEEMFDACKTWGAKGPDLGERDAVTSDIPSLVIEGSFDPATPPFYGKQVAEHIANSFYFEFPTMGHVPTGDDPCARQIVLDFLADPASQPDGSCINEIPNVDFLIPYTGTPSIELKRENLSGVSLEVPMDWILTDDGFLLRAASPFDVTQATAFQSFVTAQELVNFFSLSAYGYRGLDSVPVESGTRRANGHTWTLYNATSNQRPVDIAFAEDGSFSIIIMLFSHPDEHDALYRTVFLPMVDSAK